MGGLFSYGTYKVELDAGFYQDVFTLDDDNLGILDEDFLDGSTTYFDITEYVTNVEIKRGRNSQDEQFGAGTCSIVIDDAVGQDKFNVANSASPYWNVDRGRLGFEPRRKVRISRNDNFLFVGYIMKYDTIFNISDHNIVTVQCADGFSYLAQTNLLPSLEWDVPVEEQFSGERVAVVLGRPEINFPTEIPSIIATGIALLGEVQLEAQTPLAYINYIVESAEQGRFYINRNGALVFTERTPQATDSSPTITFSDDGTGYPYDTLEVIYE